MQEEEAYRYVSEQSIVMMVQVLVDDIESLEVLPCDENLADIGNDVQCDAAIGVEQEPLGDGKMAST